MNNVFSPILVLFGPTASGKSALGVLIAKALEKQGISTAIINADSKQQYKEIPIITAQPTREEQEGVRHLQYGVVSVKTPASTYDWVQRTAECIRHLQKQKILPLLVGGTGMYLQHLMQGMVITPAISMEIEKETQQILQERGKEGLYRLLQEKDPKTAARLSPNNLPRVLRAYKLVTQTGISLSQWQGEHHHRFFPEEAFELLYLKKEREVMYQNANQRFDAMLEGGVIEEVKALLAMQLDPLSPPMKAHGVPELRRYLYGECTLEEAASRAKQVTRHYIKRQITWMRHQFPKLTPMEEDSVPALVERLAAPMFVS